LNWLTDGGNGTVTVVDGGGNLTNPDDTENNLALGLPLDAGLLPADRTVDGGGNVYIQPNDVVTASVEVSSRQEKISAVEVMLGYNTDLLETAGLQSEPDWDNEVESQHLDADTIGLINTALGWSFSHVDPEGSDADQTIGTVGLKGLSEGQTLFFHRVKLSTDTFAGETRFTKGGPGPFFLTPFT